MSQFNSNRIDSFEEAKKLILNTMAHIRRCVPKLPIKTRKIGKVEIREGFLDGQAIERLILILRAQGCEWASSKGGGCTMCGHYVCTTQGRRIPPEDYVEQFSQEFDRVGAHKFPMVCVYNAGSFLNPKEINPFTRRVILKKLAEYDSIKSVIIESRPQYVTPEILEEIRSILVGKRIEIGIGLETHSNTMRHLLLNKGFNTDEYQRVANLIQEYGIKLLSYVLVKLPFLTEKEGIEEAVKTVEFAFENGSSIVSLEPVSVQEYTLVHLLFQMGRFRPPWIWSVFEVVRRVAILGEVRIGGFEFFPIPRVFANNCDSCNEQFLRAIADYNRSLDTKHLKGVKCPARCNRSWQSDLSIEEIALPDRVIRDLRMVDKERIESLVGISKMRALLHEEEIESFVHSCGSHLTS